MTKAQQPSRRDFLRGKAPTAAAAADMGGSTENENRFSGPSDETYLVRVGRRAMACEFQVFLNAGQYERGTEIAIEALDRVEEIERVLTVYREDSEVSHLNRMAGEDDVHVCSEVFELLQRSLELHAATQAAFDVTAGPLSEAWGFARRSGSMPTDAALAAALASVGSQHVQLDRKQGTVRFLHRGVHINFGGIGKGYALDRSAELLRQSGVNDFLFHGGKSSVLARGRRSGQGQRATWSVGLIHPLRPEQRLAEIFLSDCALSTSGSLAQSFHYQGRRLGHILDPRTGQPAEGVLSATVLAEDAATADALSTALFALGPAHAREFCECHPEVAAILVLPGPSTGSIAIETHNLEENDWRLLDDSNVASVQ